ncbi:hypothetical protein PAE9249_02945 [Paenibacillus sp. CECT 9249]|nr:hypothetical protein PAE9249_02945 [Paenibacillus sp. CECT 9249]
MIKAWIKQHVEHSPSTIRDADTGSLILQKCPLFGMLEDTGSVICDKTPDLDPFRGG